MKEPGWLIVVSSPAPAAPGPSWANAGASPAATSQQRAPRKVVPTWQPRAAAAVQSTFPPDNPLYPRIPKAPKLPSEFDGTTPTSPSIAPEIFSGGDGDEDEALEQEPSMWPAVRRVWTWLRGSSR